MFKRFYQHYIKPVSKHPDAYSRELVLNWLLVGIIALTLATAIHSLINLTILHEGYVLMRFFSIVLLLLFWIGLYWYSRTRQKQIVAGLVVVGMFFALGCIVTVLWGLFTPAGVLLFSLVIVMAGILLGARFSLYVALATMIFLTLFQIAVSISWLQPNYIWITRPPYLGDVIVHSTMYVIVALISWLFNRQMELSLGRAQRSEQALKRQRDLLEIKVEQRTRELQAAQLEKVQQFYRFAELGHLSTALFHDLANHLMSVSIDIEGLQKKPRSHILQRIQQNIRYIDTVVVRVRQQMQGKATTARFDVVEEVQEIIKIVSYHARKAEVKIMLDNTPGKRPILYTGNVTRFRQIITNLISNGIEAYRSARVPANSRSVIVSVATIPGQLVIGVTDHGRGIPVSRRAQIFEAFYSTKKQGIGIGLFIVKKVVNEDFQGAIELSSTKREGTVFTVSLPLRRHGTAKRNQHEH